MMPIRSIFSQNLFSGKVAIVTGGATGIGAAIAHELCYLGCNVVIASRNSERLQSMTKEMNHNAQLKGDVLWQKCNIRSESDIKSLISTTLEQFGKVNFLVNNGGGQFVSPAEFISAKGWNAVLDTNLTGTFSCCKQVYLDWMSTHGGAIVNIIVDMQRGVSGMAHTSAARAGVDNLTKTLSLEWAENNVRINSINPGIVDSPTARANYTDPFTLDGFISGIPAGRLGKPEEVSTAVCFLLSPAADFITGETLNADGGNRLYACSGDSILKPARIIAARMRNSKA